MIQESLSAPSHACYLPGVKTYLPGDWEGSGYFLFPPTGKRTSPTAWIREYADEEMYDSKAFATPPWSLQEGELGEDAWGQLAINPPYRELIDALLRAVLAASRDGRALLVCEVNGNVSDYKGSDILEGTEEVRPNPRVQRVGPLTIEELWRRQDAREITIPSLTIIEASSIGDVFDT